MDISLFNPATTLQDTIYSLTEHYRLLSLDTSSKHSKPIAYLLPINNTVPVKAGQLVKFKECKFYIQSILPTIIAVYLTGPISNLQENDLGAIITLYKPDDITYKIINNNIPLGSIKVRVNPPLQHRSGYLGWTLFQDDIILLVGNDLNSKSFISFDGPSLWQPGSYRLVVSSYDPYTKGLLNITDQDFVITTPTPTFEAGTSTSIYKALNL